MAGYGADSQQNNRKPKQKNSFRRARSFSSKSKESLPRFFGFIAKTSRLTEEKKTEVKTGGIL